MKTWTRKDFIKTSLLGTGAALFGSRSLANSTLIAGSPNGDIRVAVVGLNGKGATHVESFRNIPGVRVAALCDVDSDVLARNVKKFADRGDKVSAYVDYRRVLDDSSIDAVVIATPDHWHALMAIWACQAAKDVYLEKPVSHSVGEGRKIIEAAKKYRRIVSAGTQSRSDPALQEAFAYLRSGKLGRIQWVRGLCYKPRESIGRTSGPQAVPSNIDYDLWSGPAPLVAPRRNSPKKGSVHYDWHWFWNYGGGDISNQGAHEIDMCRWVLGEKGLPRAVTSIGGRFGYEDDAETPNTQIALFDYETAPLIFEVRGLPRQAGMRAMDAYKGIRIGVIVQCENGHFAGGTSGGGLYDNEKRKIKQFSSGGGGDHQANFVAAIRSRNESTLSASIEEGHVSSALCHIANISYRLGKDTSNQAIHEALRAHPQFQDTMERMAQHLESNDVRTGDVPSVRGPQLKLDSGKESFETSEKYDIGYWANTLLTRQYRKPFVLPENV